MRRNQVKSGISRTSTHHRRMKNIRMLKETKSQVNNLIFSPTGFDRRNIRADRTSEHSTIRRLATSRPWGREGAGKGTRDPSDEVAKRAIEGSGKDFGKSTLYAADYEVIVIFQYKIVTYYRTKTIT